MIDEVQTCKNCVGSKKGCESAWLGKVCHDHILDLKEALSKKKTTTKKKTTKK